MNLTLLEIRAIQNKALELMPANRLEAHRLATWLHEQRNEYIKKGGKNNVR